MSTIKKIIGSVILLFLLLGSVALSSLNATTVTLDLYWHSWEMPLGFMLLVFAALGLLVGLVLCWLLWVLPAAKQRRYWERSYFQLKQEQDAQTQAEDKSPQGVVKIP